MTRRRALLATILAVGCTTTTTAPPADPSPSPTVEAPPAGLRDVSLAVTGMT